MKNNLLTCSGLLISIVTLISTGCVSKQKYIESQIALRNLKNDSIRLSNRIASLDDYAAQLQYKIDSLNNKIASLNKESDAIAKEFSQSRSELEANRRSLMSQQQKLNQLQTLLDEQKRKANALKEKMSEALSGFKSNELTVTQKNGKVYVSLQENLLFPSGSAQLNPKGISALGKLASVLNQNPEISIDVEGHTDSVPIILGKVFKDNWELSTERALSIVRILTSEYEVDPKRIIAAGHSQYDPVAPNETAEGRAQNRRTDIILSPKLDELYKLLEN